MNTNTLIKFRNSDKTIVIKTYSRNKKQRHELYVDKQELERFISSYIPYSIGLFDGVEMATIRSDNDSLRLVFANDSIRYEIPKSQFVNAVKTEGTILWSEKQNYPVLDFSRCNNAIKNIVKSRKTRRAFSKSLKTSFKWIGSKRIEFYDDGNKSFFFREYLEKDNLGICGGLIHSDWNGKEQFSIHT